MYEQLGVVNNAEIVGMFLIRSVAILIFEGQHLLVPDRPR